MGAPDYGGIEGPRRAFDAFFFRLLRARQAVEPVDGHAEGSIAFPLAFYCASK